LHRAIATRFKEEGASTLIDRMEKVQSTVSGRPGECNKESATLLRDAP
jgi:hypothetical protein